MRTVFGDAPCLKLSVDGYIPKSRIYFCRVSIRTSTDIPGASLCKSVCLGCSSILTTMRWAILTKLPVPLSALMMLNSEAVAGAISLMLPLKCAPPRASTVMSAC